MLKEYKKDRIILLTTHYMDEAERCHKLAILENGIKRADGSPEQLMKDMNAHVIDLTATDIRSLKKSLIEIPAVISAAQLGARLRVLIKKDISDPLLYLSQLPFINESNECGIVRPSLEDVFVTCTGKGRQK